MRKHGYELPDDILGADEIRALEPSLNDRVKAGFHLQAQWNVKADTMTVGLGAKLRESGVEIVEGAEVTGFVRVDRVVRAARTTRGDVTADAFVLAAGSWTAPLDDGRRTPHPRLGEALPERVHRDGLLDARDDAVTTRRTGDGGDDHDRD